MSRIGKQPISIPSGVKVEISPGVVVATGPMGKLEARFPEAISVVKQDESLNVTRATDERQHRAFHGLTRALVNNAIVGVSEGFTKTLDIEGVGYRAAMEGQGLNIAVGFSHPVKFPPPDGIAFEVQPGPAGTKINSRIVIKGPSKEQVGQVAANIRRIRPPEPYKGKGIRYEGEYIRRKAGKAAK